MGAMQRNKGAGFERLVAAVLTAAGVPARRGIGQARSAGEVPDVEVPDAPALWVECKHGAAPSWRAALAQARAAAPGRVHVVVTRDNRGPPTAHIPLGLFAEMLVAWVRAQRAGGGPA